MKQIKTVGIILLTTVLLVGCGTKQPKMHDGSYTAQMLEYSNGWREYVTITVENGEIVTTEYNAENASGFIKSWDNDYMKRMKLAKGTYPNEYTRLYAAQLTGQTKAPKIDAITGASHSGENFQRLSYAVVEQAIKGDSAIVLLSPSSLN